MSLSQSMGEVAGFSCSQVLAVVLSHLQEDWMLRERLVSSSGSTTSDLGPHTYMRVIITGPTPWACCQG